MAVVAILVWCAAVSVCEEGPPSNRRRLAEAAFYESDQLLGTSGRTFGGAVAISGSLVVVGSTWVGGPPYSRDPAFVFRTTNDGRSFEHTATLTPSDSLKSRAAFGSAVAISGNLVVVGAYESAYNPYDDDQDDGDPGGVYVYRTTDGGNSFVETCKLEGSVYDDDFGFSVAISNNLVVVGATGEGAAYLFNTTDNGLTFEQTRIWTGGIHGGWAVAISNDIIIVSAGHDAAGSSVVNVYRMDNESIPDTATQTLTPTGAGSSIIGFGSAIGISGDLVVVGAPHDDDAGTYSGAAYIFSKAGSSDFVQTQKLSASDAASYDFYGSAVAISGNIVIVSSYSKGSGTVYVYRTTDGGLNFEETQKLFGGVGNDGDFGLALAIQGDVAIAGAPYYGDHGVAFSFKNVNATTPPTAAPTPMPTTPMPTTPPTAAPTPMPTTPMPTTPAPTFPPGGSKKKSSSSMTVAVIAITVVAAVVVVIAATACLAAYVRGFRAEEECNEAELTGVQENRGLL